MNEKVLVEPLVFPEFWIEAATGSSVVAAQAMQLPDELRQSLYGDVMEYGPAGERIGELYSAIYDMAVYSNGPELLNLLIGLAPADDAAKTQLDSQKGSSYKAFVILEDRLRTLAEGYTPYWLGETGRVPDAKHLNAIWGAFSLGWMLSMPYLLPDDDALDPYIDDANFFLRKLGLPAIGVKVVHDAG